MQLDFFIALIDCSRSNMANVKKSGCNLGIGFKSRIKLANKRKLDLGKLDSMLESRR